MAAPLVEVVTGPSGSAAPTSVLAAALAAHQQQGQPGGKGGAAACSDKGALESLVLRVSPTWQAALAEVRAL